MGARRTCPCVRCQPTGTVRQDGTRTPSSYLEGGPLLALGLGPICGEAGDLAHDALCSPLSCLLASEHPGSDAGGSATHEDVMRVTRIVHKGRRSIGIWECRFCISLSFSINPKSLPTREDVFGTPNAIIFTSEKNLVEAASF